MINLFQVIWLGQWTISVRFRISLNASVAGDSDKGDGDLEDGEDVKEGVDAVDKWVC